MVVLNDATVEGAAFGGDTNIVTLIDRFGHQETLPKLTKWEVSRFIWERIFTLLNRS
jgi:phosphopantothenoylcysteine decarboxylase/phosphopantothenate--cysteine ligase